MLGKKVNKFKNVINLNFIHIILLFNQIQMILDKIVLIAGLIN